MAYMASQNAGKEATKKSSRYPETWRRAYLLEIVINGQTKEIFTFSLPPENVEITFPQRVSETKTFGGVFVDDYGPEVAKIVLSGITGNQETRTIYRGNLGNLTLNGKDEIYYIRDHIIRYKENNKDYGNAHLYLYNLSVINEEEIKKNDYKASTDSWEVVLKDFRITQSKERPFWYNYSIEFTGLRILGTKPKNDATIQQAVFYKQADQKLSLADQHLSMMETPENAMMVATDTMSESTLAQVNAAAESLPKDYYPKLPSEDRVIIALTEANASAGHDVLASDQETFLLHGNVISTENFKALGATTKDANKLLKSVQSARANAKSIMRKGGFLQNAYQWSTQIAAPIKQLRRSVNTLRSQVNMYKNLIAGTVKNTLFSIPLQMVGLAKDVESLGVGLVTAPADIGIDILNGFHQVRRGFESLAKQTVEMPSYVTNRYKKVADMFNKEVESLIQKSENNVNSVIAKSKSISVIPDVLVVPATQNTVSSSEGVAGDTSNEAGIRVVVVNGYEHVAATATTTLEQLATEYLGNADEAGLIAVVNGISDDSQIIPGIEIKIPSTNGALTIPGNEVYSRDDNYGKDIALSDNGEIIIDASGELSTVSDNANIGQAIKSRLSESIGNRVRLTVYGIKSGAGQPITAAVPYVATSIKDTVIADPRILRIENFTFQGVGDRLYVRFEYITVDKRRHVYEGVQ